MRPLSILGLLCLGVFVAGCDNKKVPEQSVEATPQVIAPYSELGGIKIGTKEVDLTLTYGQPSCDEGSPSVMMNKITMSPYPEDMHIDSGEKVWMYEQLQKCGVAIYLNKKPNMGYVVTKICAGFPPDGYSYPESEESVGAKLGQPSSTSINTDGTQRISNYDKYHLAINTKQKTVVNWCVTEKPIRFATEYKPE